MTVRNRKSLLAVIPAALTLAVPTFAQAPTHPNAIQRHPTMSGVAAGAATHHMLKVSARNKKAHHQHLSFAERHPTLSAIGAGMATHHIIKKTTH